MLGFRSPGTSLPVAQPAIYSRLVTATLPDEVQQVFDRFITTEFTTVDRK